MLQLNERIDFLYNRDICLMLFRAINYLYDVKVTQKQNFSKRNP